MTNQAESGRPLTDGQVRTAVQASLARSRARRNELSIGQKITRWTLALGGAAILAFGVNKGGKLAADTIHNAFHSADLQGKLKEPIGEVAGDVRAGDIDPDDVTKVRVDSPQSAWEAADKLAGEEHPAQPVSDIIVAQQGERLQTGDHLILPEDSIEPIGPVEPPK